jgi:transcriptional regulator with PAS, ATPase and Fis domain
MNVEQRMNLKVEELGTRNAAMARCLKLALLAAKSEVPLLILGETGTGKTLLAQAIHNSSARAAGPFISFNASAMSDTLLESQLFGHERGAFTGAQKTLKGKFELADAGTLFLDEIADISPLAQAKILRAVEWGEFERLGSERSLHSNARIFSATNRSLRSLISEGRFREDLYHRLNGLTLHIPSLRDRKEDLPAMIGVEIKLAAAESGKTVTAIDPAAMKKLLAHSWPGNLREMRHAISTMLLLADGEIIGPEHIQFEADSSAASPLSNLNGREHNHGLELDAQNDLTLAGAVRAHIRRVRETVNGNQRNVAAILGISRATLSRHLQRVEEKSQG